jgi:hypothetical protein
MAHAPVARCNQDLDGFGEESCWWKISGRLPLLHQRYADASAGSGEREGAHPCESFDIGNQEQPHRRFIEGDRLSDRSDQVNPLPRAKTR